MAGLLRFFFVERFNRFDALVIVTASVLYTQDRLGFLGMLAVLLSGFMLSAAGEAARERREAQP